MCIVDLLEKRKKNREISKKKEIFQEFLNYEINYLIFR